MHSEAPRTHDGSTSDRFAARAIRAVLGFALLLGILAVGVANWVALREQPVPLDEAERASLLARLRDGVNRAAAGVAGTAASEWLRSPDRDEIGLARLFCEGRPVATSPIRRADHGAVECTGFESDPAVSVLSSDARRDCRIALDFFVGRAPVFTAVEALFALSVIPGVDGIGLEYGAREGLLMPDELLREGLLAGYRPVPQLDFEAGLDARAVLRTLAIRAGADSTAWRRTPHRVFRFRTRSFVEPARLPDGDQQGGAAAALLPLFRQLPSGPRLDAAALRAGALAGARYLARHLHPDGRFAYQYDTVRDVELPDGRDYSLPRHAGASYFLSQAAGAFADPVLRDAAQRAVEWLATHKPPGCDEPAWACAGAEDDRVVDLGSSAMALLAATEYQQRTGDQRFLPWARRLAAFLLRMQRPTGDFRHLYDLDAARPDENARLLYYSGEATLALARLAALDDAGAPDALRRPALAAAVDRGLDHLTAGAYDYFAGRFFFGEDHWTCLALDAAWDLLPDAARRDRYADFCEGFARFQERTRFTEGEGPTRDQPDLVGAYGFTPFIAPHPTPVGSRAEALISVYRVAQRRGHDDTARAVAEGVRGGMRFLLAHQVRPDNALLMARPDLSDGGFLMSDVVRYVRIDFVQHACSAMLRASEVPALSSAE